MAWIAVGVAGVGAITKIVSGIHQGNLANQIHPMFQQYQASPYAAAQLGTAQQAYQSRMPGANDIYQGINASQQGVISNVNRNATDSSQALAIAQQGQGQANAAYTNLGDQEAQYKASMLNNLNAGYGAMIGEGDKVYNSMFQKYQTQVGQQAALRGNSLQNISGGINDVASDASLANQSQQNAAFQKQLLGLYGGLNQSGMAQNNNWLSTQPD